MYLPHVKASWLLFCGNKFKMTVWLVIWAIFKAEWNDIEQITYVTIFSDVYFGDIL